MSMVSFEGIGEMVATFYAGSGVKAGQVAKLNADSTVAACDAGDRFVGVAVNVDSGYAGVQVKGFAKAACSDPNVTVGYITLAADGEGGVKKVTEGGQEYAVIAKDSDSVTVLL